MFVAAVFLCGVAQDAYPVETPTPRALYVQAAQLLESGISQPAVRVLQDLVEQHGDSYYAEIAALHLAECYVILEEPQKALKLLDEWRDRLRFPSTETASLAPDLYRRAQVVRTSAARAAADACERNEEFASALCLLQQAAMSADEAEIKQIERDILRVVVCGCLQDTREDDSVELLLAELEPHRQLPARFALSERCIKECRFKEAEEQLDWLVTQARKEGSEQLPDWAFTVDLRRCEVAVQQKAFARAQAILGVCQSKYAEHQRCYEFDFLAARCAMAQIDFEGALSTLRRIANSPSVPTPMRAKTLWMQGEIYFLKEEFDLAISEYRQVADLDVPVWQSRALLQMAKCQELCRQAAEALQSYQRLQSQFPQAPESAEAAERIAHLIKYDSELKK